MGPFGFFTGKDPAALEARGDGCFEGGDFGRARLEYEAALKKRRRETPNDSAIPGLEGKIARCLEALAREHGQRGDGLGESGYPEDAREAYLLALELTRDADLARDLGRRLREVESRTPGAGRMEPAASAYPEPDDVPPPAPESESEYAEALLQTVPDDAREAYLGYGENFRNGYVALHRGRFDAALELLSRALEENPDPAGYVRLELATAYLNLNRTEEARAMLEGFVGHRPDSAPAIRMLCEIYWDAGAYDRALDLLGAVGAGERAVADFGLLEGETLVRAGRFREAVSLYSDWTARHGFDREIAQAHAAALEAAGEKDHARELYGRVLEECRGCRAPALPAVERSYADLSMEAGIRNERILEIYLGLAEKDPANADAYYRQVSRIYAALGHEREARRFRQIASRGGGEGSPGD